MDRQSKAAKVRVRTNSSASGGGGESGAASPGTPVLPPIAPTEPEDGESSHVKELEDGEASTRAVDAMREDRYGRGGGVATRVPNKRSFEEAQAADL